MKGHGPNGNLTGCKKSASEHRKIANEHLKAANSSHGELQHQVKWDGQDFNDYKKKYNKHMGEAMNHSLAAHDHDGKAMGDWAKQQIS